MLAKLPGKTIILGVIDLNDMTVETPETVAERIRRALPYVPAAKIIVAPDCGMKYLPRDVAFGKMQAMVAGAAIVRAEVGGEGAGVAPAGGLVRLRRVRGSGLRRRATRPRPAPPALAGGAGSKEGLALALRRRPGEIVDAGPATPGAPRP